MAETVPLHQVPAGNVSWICIVCRKQVFTVVKLDGGIAHLWSEPPSGWLYCSTLDVHVCTVGCAKELLKG